MMSGRSRRRLPGAVWVVLTACVALLGCSPALVPPADVQVSVVQERLDIAADRMSIRVENGGADPVEILEVELVDARFADAVVWSGDSTVPAGSARALRVDLPRALCTDKAEGPVLETSLLFDIDGTRVHASYDAADPFDLIVNTVAEQCFAAEVERVADIRVESVSLDGSVAVVEMSVDRHGDAPLRIESIAGTTLLAPRSELRSWPIGLDVAAGASSFEFRVRPSRCDPHVIAENKVGTIFKLALVVGDESGILSVPADEAQRAALIDFVVQACDLYPK